MATHPLPCFAPRRQELFKLDASRVSSRWCEYTFQFLRCCDRTSTTFGTLAAKQRMSIVLGQMMLECSSDLEFQRAKRGAPRGKASAYASLVSQHSPRTP